MSVQITIRGVPDEVRNELAARAAMQRQSMQEFLLGELERIACRPTVDAWLRVVRDRKEISAAEVGAAAILRERDADRRAGAFETCSSDEFLPDVQAHQRPSLVRPAAHALDELPGKAIANARQVVEHRTHGAE